MEVIAVHRGQITTDVQQEATLAKAADSLRGPVETIGGRFSHRQVGGPRHEVGSAVADHAPRVLPELRDQL